MFFSNEIERLTAEAIATGDYLRPDGTYSGHKIFIFENTYFKLTQSIDLGGHNFMVGSHVDWKDFSGFAGIFDGNNCTIRNMAVSKTGESAALFGCVQHGGLIKDLSVYGTVNGDGIVGSVVAYLLGGLDNVTNYATITVTHSVIDGVIRQGTAGGLVANQEHKADPITNCVNYGNITCDSYIVGGIVGSAGATVKNCTNWGLITGNDSIGGIAGTTKNQTEGTTISNCYNYGTISGKNVVGGIVGLVLGIMGNKKEKTGMGTAGIVLGIIAIVFGIASIIIGLIFADALEDYLVKAGYQF
jgi:hypothetical protein